MIPPATATQILHDEPQISKPIAETTKPNNHNNENTALFKKVNTPSVTKNKKQSSISDLVMLTKKKKGIIKTIKNMKDKMIMAKTPSIHTFVVW